MVWPAANVNTTNADAGTDSPAAFRDDVLDLINKFNQLRAHPSPFIQGLLDDIDAAAARATLGAASTTGNESIDGSKSFVKGVGVAGQAADETGWTLTGYLRGLLLPATRAIWWAKGAASRSIGIVRQSGSNLLRLVSSTADDGTAAAFNALTVDAATGDVVMGGAASANSAFLRTDGGRYSGILTFEKPSTDSTLAGNVANGISGNIWLLFENAGTNRGVQLNLADAPASFAGQLVYIVAESVGPNGWRKWSNGVIEQWGRGPIDADLPSGIFARSVAFPTAFLSSVDTVVLQVVSTAGASSGSVVAHYRADNTTLSTLAYWVQETASFLQSGVRVDFRAWGR